MFVVEEVFPEEGNDGIRDREKIGLILAVGKDKVGFSMCSVLEKKWNLERGVSVAYGRAKKGKDWTSKFKKMMEYYRSKGDARSLGQVLRLFEVYRWFRKRVRRLSFEGG